MPDMQVCAFSRNTFLRIKRIIYFIISVVLCMLRAWKHILFYARKPNCLIWELIDLNQYKWPGFEDVFCILYKNGCTGCPFNCANFETLIMNINIDRVTFIHLLFNLQIWTFCYISWFTSFSLTDIQNGQLPLDYIIWLWYKNYQQPSAEYLVRFHWQSSQQSV